MEGLSPGKYKVEREDVPVDPQFWRGRGTRGRYLPWLASALAQYQVMLTILEPSLRNLKCWESYPIESNYGSPRELRPFLASTDFCPADLFPLFTMWDGVQFVLSASSIIYPIFYPTLNVNSGEKLAFNQLRDVTNY